MNAIPSVTATQLKNETGSVLDQAMRGPVKLTSHGRPRVYIVPAETFERLIALEEVEIAKRAKLAVKKGMIGPDASMALIQSLLNAPAKPVSGRGKIVASRSVETSQTTGRKTAATRSRSASK